MKKLREYKVALTKCAPGEHAVDLDSVNNLGLRTKLGGEPDWEQNNEHPDCPSCTTPMSFVAQIDSIEHWSDANPHSRNPIGQGRSDFMFGDVGMIYVFFCFDCLESKSIFNAVSRVHKSPDSSLS
jgi:uncharacterized protein YwqG